MLAHLEAFRVEACVPRLCLPPAQCVDDVGPGPIDTGRALARRVRAIACHAGIPAISPWAASPNNTRSRSS